MAILTKSSGRDVALAEDALSEAFLKALSTWPDSGVPSSPEAWLIRTARNAIVDRFRHVQVTQVSIELLLDRLETRPQEYPDQRMALMFVCCHPAISSEIRTPLILQTVLGLRVEQIASAFLVSPSALEKRLVRAKRKIKEAGIPFEIPSASELPERLEDVLQAIYAAYGTSWHERTEALEDEAIFLLRLVSSLLPQEPEGKGLLALMLFCSSRKHARSNEGCFVPLDAQDVNLWNLEFIAEAEKLLSEASSHQRPGRFQLEAAIQSAQVARLYQGVDTRAEILALYRGLVSSSPSVGAWISYGSAVLTFGDPAEAKKIIDSLDQESLLSYQPFWVLKAEISFAFGDQENGREGLMRAIGLTADVSVKKFLSSRLPAPAQG